MPTGTAPTRQDSDDDASKYSFSWISQNSPDDPPEIKTIYFNLYTTPGFRSMSNVVNYRVYSVEASLEFSLNCKLWRWTPYIGPNQRGNPIKVFSCSVEGTRLIPAKLGMPIKDRPDQNGSLIPSVVGPYTESINLQMGFDDPRAELHLRSPDTDIQRGEVTTSISYSFSGGFFGSTPTESFGATYSHSATMNLTDYLIRSDSDVVRTNHSILMEMLADGNRYEDVNSISYMEFPPAWHANNNLLTARSTSDLTMAMQGLWLLPGDSDEELVFRVRVTAVCPLLACLLPPPGVILPIDSLPTGVSLGDEGTATRQEFGAVYPQGKFPNSCKFVFAWERDVKVPLAAVDKVA